METQSEDWKVSQDSHATILFVQKGFLFNEIKSIHDDITENQTTQSNFKAQVCVLNI